MEAVTDPMNPWSLVVPLGLLLTILVAALYFIRVSAR
jgi:hypothetical protein